MASRQPQLPLRLGIIGLSANATTSWASRAHLPGLLTERGKRDYAIRALCNSSVEAAENAIKTYELASDVKAYGNPEDLAADEEIDVVICSTRVDKHYETILPSVKAGKKVFVEWPIASNAKQIEELVQAAKSSGAEVAVCLQGRWVPPIAKIGEIISSGKLGKVLSSNLTAFGGVNTRNGLPPGLDYFLDWKVGGNVIVIGFGHLLDFTLSALGAEFIPNSSSARTQIQWGENNIIDPKTKEIVRTAGTDVPDLISVHGALVGKKSENLAHNATFSLQYRRGQPFKDEPSLLWHINCEKGEIRLKSMDSVALQASGYENPPLVQIHHFHDDSVEDVAWEWEKEQLDVPVFARGVMRCLYAFAESDTNAWVRIEDAALRAAQIDAWVTEGKW